MLIDDNKNGRRCCFGWAMLSGSSLCHPMQKSYNSHSLHFSKKRPCFFVDPNRFLFDCRSLSIYQSIYLSIFPSFISILTAPKSVSFSKALSLEFYLIFSISTMFSSLSTALSPFFSKFTYNRERFSKH